MTLRYALRSDPEHPFSEVVGVVASVEEDDVGPAVSIARRSGETVTVRLGDVTAAKVFVDQGG